MKARHNLLKISLVGLVLLVLVRVETPVASSNQSPVLLEIMHSCCEPDYDYDKTLVYANGHYVREEVFQEKAESGKTRKVVHKEEKDLEPSELIELMSWANAPDFLTADAEYVVTIVRDNPDWIAITNRDGGRDKKVTVFNFSRGNPQEKTKVPPSFLKIARWANPHSSLFQ